MILYVQWRLWTVMEDIFALIDSGKLEEVRMRVKRNPALLNASKSWEGGWSVHPLGWAAFRNQEGIIRTLVEGNDVDQCPGEAKN